MRRIATVFAALALTGAFATGALADPPAPATMGMAPGAVIVAACHPSDDVTTRFATFVGEMRALPGTTRMAMRFTLLQRLGTPDFTAVGLPELRPWRRSKKGASRLHLHAARHRAARRRHLPHARADALVRDRPQADEGAHDALGRLQAARAAPNLRISSISTRRDRPAARTSYMVTVQNDGAGDAGPVVVGLRVDGGTLSTARVPTLAAGQAASVRLTGPACTATLRAIADPGNAIRETARRTTRLVEACPS